jgi:hypothetical protein
VDLTLPVASTTTSKKSPQFDRRCRLVGHAEGDGEADKRERIKRSAARRRKRARESLEMSFGVAAGPS